MEERWINLEGLKIRYLESGKGKNRHVVFIHGLGSAADRWMKIPEMLSSDFHCVAIDLPGFGESDKPEKIEYTIDRFSQFVISFQKKISIFGGKTSLIGHSLGGYIASEITIQNPNQVKQLVLVDSSGMLNHPTPILEEYLLASKNPSENKVRSAFEKMVADPKRIPQPLVDGFIRRINMPNAKHAFQSTLENSAKTQIGLERLRMIKKTPTLIIWGAQDRVIPIEHSRFFLDAIENSRLEIIDDAGHAPFAEKPKQFCEILGKFLLQETHQR